MRTLLTLLGIDPDALDEVVGGEADCSQAMAQHLAGQPVADDVKGFCAKKGIHLGTTPKSEVDKMLADPRIQEQLRRRQQKR